LRIVLSNIGTLGDINPVIAIALELKRRGHVPVMAVPAVYAPSIVPLGLEFHAVRPDIDPANTLMAEMIYDVERSGGCGSFFFRCCGRRMKICWMRRRGRSGPI